MLDWHNIILRKLLHEDFELGRARESLEIHNSNWSTAWKPSQSRLTFVRINSLFACLCISKNQSYRFVYIEFKSRWRRYCQFGNCMELSCITLKALALPFVVVYLMYFRHTIKISKRFPSVVYLETNFLGNFLHAPIRLDSWGMLLDYCQPLLGIHGLLLGLCAVPTLEGYGIITWHSCWYSLL